MFLEKNRIDFIFRRMSLRVREERREDLRLQIIDEEKQMNLRRDISKFIYFEDHGIDDTSCCVLLSYSTLFPEKEKEKERRLPTTCGMTRFLGESLKGDSEQELLFAPCL